MQPLRHGYTNRTLGDGETVVKCYQGPGTLVRSRRERAVLRALRGRVPVPQVLDSGDGWVTMRFVGGIQGQDLLDLGRAPGVLRACGAMLRRIHQLDVAGIRDSAWGPVVDGQVLVHGDYGPNNVLLDPASLEITAVLDWEWAHAGNPVEDLAWCEWIVRMHHPGQVSVLGEFFGAYGGTVPSWEARHAVMIQRCRSLLDFSGESDPGGPGEAQWVHRLAVTRAWRE
ncbi:MAG TPA: aminoglycoside phosphotransferase family protein [Streptosporangiaceae bacterium]|nr:aminoglycoside phosphotransferase family protein [Streptosporangiaceae bacterium]